MQGQKFLILIEARLSNLSYAKVQVTFCPGAETVAPLALSWP